VRTAFKPSVCKATHDKFINWAYSDDVNTVQHFQWLGVLSMHGESESTILAIQDQVLCTKVYQGKVICCPITTLVYRFCHAIEEETLQHLLAGCEALALYTKCSIFNGRTWLQK